MNHGNAIGGDLPSPSPAQSAALKAIVAHAASYRGERNGTLRAERLLRAAARRIEPDHFAAGMHALADLVAAHPERGLTP